MTPVLFAHQVKNWNTAPWAWPHDGLQHDKGSGKQLAAAVPRRGPDLTAEHATFDDETFGVEAGVMQMLERMLTGRWKVLANLAPWWEEFRVYHREDGVIVKSMDDTICARATPDDAALREVLQHRARAGLEDRPHRGRPRNPLNV
jgi:hypothetical protein